MSLFIWSLLQKRTESWRMWQFSLCFTLKP